ncbi:hypothetical protein BKA66DRAFT_458253 [Pyrenochaeta sp. MPI-SDFR-AT-0127]|nr:hypothetical protein BKA66DRAFT_458253 [Pyrenochaeta sp. MPI-SDFR-AT-0127]
MPTEQERPGMFAPRQRPYSGQTPLVRSGIATHVQITDRLLPPQRTVQSPSSPQRYRHRFNPQQRELGEPQVITLSRNRVGTPESHGGAGPASALSMETTQQDSKYPVPIESVEKTNAESSPSKYPAPRRLSIHLPTGPSLREELLKLTTEDVSDIKSFRRTMPTSAAIAENGLKEGLGWVGRAIE